ncbi:MAG: methyltransferase domain-containing protein [Magnetococcales bacterium]|nr:methyltransferase domain-containing protein [Magnetococcales bacterium]
MNNTHPGERLHLGCGGFAPPGWINTDGSWHVWLARWPLVKRLALAIGLLPAMHRDHPWPDSILRLDLRRRLPFPAERLSAVYSSHVLEHLHRAEALALLGEIRRCLRPGGVARMAVPDLAFHLEEYRQGRILPEAPGATPADTLMHRLYLRPPAPPGGSWPRRLYHAVLDFNSHKWLYDQESLCALFREAGFASPEACPLLTSRIPGIEHIERPERIGGGGTLIVEAEK